MAMLYLVRHAPTPDTGKRLSGRLPGVGLDDRGRRVAEAVARSLESIPLIAIYTSPLLRCRQTARIIAAGRAMEPTPHRGLIEVDYGTWTGRTLAGLRRTPQWKTLMVSPSRVRFPDGESIPEIHARSVAACESLAGVHRRETIALVSHGDVIKTITAHYLGVPLDLYQRIWIEPGSTTVIELLEGHAPRVMGVNRIPEAAD